jgi:hypothetical protein
LQVWCLIKTKGGSFVEDLLNIIPAKFGSNWPSIFREDKKAKSLQSYGKSSHDILD